MKLVSMVDYVLTIEKGMLCTADISKEKLYFIVKYAKFLKQPLKLEMFVPCDDEGEPLEKPKQLNGVYDTEKDAIEAFEYCSAREKVLFKGFEFKLDVTGGCLLNYGGQVQLAEYLFIMSDNLEGLMKYFSDIELTENAIKQLK